MSHEIAEADANLAEIVRLRGEIASAWQAYAESERALEATRAKLRRVESTVRDWADRHMWTDQQNCPTCEALHRIARGEP